MRQYAKDQKYVCKYSLRVLVNNELINFGATTSPASQTLANMLASSTAVLRSADKTAFAGNKHGNGSLVTEKDNYSMIYFEFSLVWFD